MPGFWVPGARGYHPASEGVVRNPTLASSAMVGGVCVRRREDVPVLAGRELWTGGDGTTGGFHGDVEFGEVSSVVRGDGGARVPSIAPSFGRRAE